VSVAFAFVFRRSSFVVRRSSFAARRSSRFGGFRASRGT
jgi:hypothetical protein